MTADAAKGEGSVPTATIPSQREMLFPFSLDAYLLGCRFGKQGCFVVAAIELVRRPTLSRDPRVPPGIPEDVLAVVPPLGGHLAGSNLPERVGHGSVREPSRSHFYCRTRTKTFQRMPRCQDGCQGGCTSPYGAWPRRRGRVLFLQLCDGQYCLSVKPAPVDLACHIS